MAVLNDEQTMLRDMAREWVDNEAPVSAFRKLRDGAPPEGFDAATWGEIGQMGWPGIVVPEDYGGSAFGYLSLGLVLEQMGRNRAAPASPHIAMPPHCPRQPCRGDQHQQPPRPQEVKLGDGVEQMTHGAGSRRGAGSDEGALQRA